MAPLAVSATSALVGLSTGWWHSSCSSPRRRSTCEAGPSGSGTAMRHRYALGESSRRR